MARRVLFIESGPGHGGSAFSLLRLVKSLDRARYEPHVVVFHDAHAFDDIRSLGVPVTTLRISRPVPAGLAKGRGAFGGTQKSVSFYGNLAADTLVNGMRLRSYIRRNGIDVVHLNNGIVNNLCGVLGARLAHIPCVSHARGTESLLKVEKRCAPWISAVITLNSTMRAHYASAFGSQKTHLIHNGVDLDAFQAPDPERIRREFRIEPHDFAVGTFARVVDGKGIPEFLAAADRVSKAEPHARFFVVGGDSAKDRAFEIKMRERADRMGLGSQVVFMGWRSDRNDVMAAMDLILQISTTFPEGMSLAPLEAMALGKPVIVTNIPGYEFCVDDGRTGFVIEPGDIQALTEKVQMLARDRHLALKMGQEGYQKALKEFDVRLTAAAVQEVYDQILGLNQSALSQGRPQAGRAD